MAKKKGNKDVLKSINYSLDIVKKCKSNYKFTKEEKQEILHKFIGLSEDNNSYFTPEIICKLITECLDIKCNDTVADLSGGIGNMAIPLIDTYGKLKDDISFDIYELDENTSLAGKMTWEDYSQVNYYGNINTLSLNIEKKYDFVIGNPPFSGNTEYETEWNVNTKGKPSKKNELVNSFIDLSFKCCKDNGYVALVLPGGILYKDKATKKLREYLAERYDLKMLIELNPDTFSKSGLQGTTVTTNLIIWQKCKTSNNKTMIIELNPIDNLKTQLESIPHYFKLVQNQHYIQMGRSNNDKIYGLLKEGINPETIHEEYTENQSNMIGQCYCCNKDIYEDDLLSCDKYTLKSDNSVVNVCLECSNDELMYIDKIKRDLLIEGKSYDISSKDEKFVKRLIEQKIKMEELEKQFSYDKNIYICTNNARDTFIDEMSPIHSLNFVKLFQGVDEYNDDSVIKIKLPYIVNKQYDFSNEVICKKLDFKRKRIIEDGIKKFIDEPYYREVKFDKLIYIINDLNIEHYKARKPGDKEWNDRERHIYHGYLDCGSDFYNTTFTIIYYPHDKKASTYVNYDFICSMSWKFKQPIEKVIIPNLLGDVSIY